MQRAWQNAEAAAKRERMLEHLERGIPLADLQEVKTKEIKTEGGATIGANCSLDARLLGGKMIEVVCLPVVRGEVETSGLLLRLVYGTVNHYKRLGVFSVLHRQLEKLPHPSGDEIFLLV